MAGRHLKALLATHPDPDDLAFRRAAHALIDEEESKSHHVLARDLKRLMASGTRDGYAIASLPLPEPPTDRDTALPLADITVSDRLLGDLVLSAALLHQLTDLVAEVHHWPTLDALNVPRRN